MLDADDPDRLEPHGEVVQVPPGFSPGPGPDAVRCGECGEALANGLCGDCVLLNQAGRYCPSWANGGE